ncbi:MAG TPA: hypothetical protein VF996_02900 [Candidatus Saccharimonadales bacterium]|jgi:thiosulfate dehydrogenase [quinone] large subunit
MAKNKANKAAKVWGLARIFLGLTFLWAFFDKLIGFGFATCRDAQTDEVVINCAKSWLNGGSPTAGFLNFGTHGPLADFYQGLAGNPVTDWLFMLGLLGIGTALLLGIGMRIAVVSGVLLLLMMWTAAFPPANNPLIDDHIIYALVLIGLLKVNNEQALGLRSWWRGTNLVKHYPVLE